MKKLIRQQIKPIAEFKVKPSPRSKFYFTVKIFTNSLELQEYAVEECRFKPEDMKNVRGLSQNWTTYDCKGKGNRAIKTGDSGQILLAKDWLFSHVVIHEVTHSALSLMRSKKISLDTKDDKWAGDGEEWLCDAIGNMSQQIFKVLNEDKLW